ncbi:MAG: hypothetical protein J0L52_03195 [Caulobacterales bacterium]|nr:hypothetical protein [Caulobacterales bacterium]
MISTLLIAALVLVGVQDPPAGVTATPAPRTEAQAQLDVCLFSRSADAACLTMLEAEAGLVPPEAFAAGDSMAWADVACADDRLVAGQNRSDCRREQRALYRRAERARAALTSGTAGGVYAEAMAAPPPAATGVGDPDGLAFSESRRAVGDNCEQSASARRDQDTGNNSSSHTFTCSFGNSEEGRERARRTLEAVMEAD